MRALVLILLLAAPFASALPTPGASGEATLTALGRVFPEALQTNDYVSYAEAVAGLALLGGMAPDRMEIVSLGPSRGWEPLGGGARVTADLFAVEVTNEKSPVPADEKLTLVFYLSIHGNEKGAREGGLRVIEDLARGVGLAAEDEGLLPMLDYQRLVFIFANSDGWTHEEVLNAATGEPAPPVRTVGFTRENGAGIDLNRQFPTVGYLFEEYTPLGEPEARAMVNYTSTLRNVVAGADMHGMVENTNLVRLLLKDGEKSQQRLFENERLAELYKERLNGNPHYDAWAAAPDQPGVCCGQVAEWAATFDAIGYSASGTAGAFIVQRQGLDAPGYTVEFAYNHYLTDNHYEGAGAWLNDLHVEAVRDVVAVFMKYASEKVRLSVETHGLRTAVLQTAYVATSADDEAPLSGWAAENDADDAFDVVHKPFRATPAAYWDDLAAYARAGDGVGVLDTYDDAQTLLARLGDYDQVVVPGSAAARLAG
ncbi:MAG TPA: M14 family zinc carboxypeptidase, partial [Candidatus Thermoplasmatota archaeon]|nr:M14 family zinc carboxypeptidase [Candidatus Thermoplasmatota archaeon]